MQRKKYTEEQIINVLKEGAAGAPVADLCSRYGMSDASYYNSTVDPHHSPPPW